MHFVLVGNSVVVDHDTLTVTGVQGLLGQAMLSARDTAGKHYFEVAMFSGASSYAGVYETRSLATLGYWHASAFSAASSQGAVELPDTYANYRSMIAYDLDAGKIWFGRDGTWLNSGNPETGANPIYSGLAGASVVPGVVINTASASVQFFVTPATWLHAPAGFAPPTESSPLVKQYLFHDPNRPGNNGIAGTITEFNVPGAYRVRVHDEITGFPLADTWSAEDGSYAFDHLNAKSKYVIAFDHTNPLQVAAIMDKVVPS